nr:hypothetical protein [uncultured Psychroserpens sp.]
MKNNKTKTLKKIIIGAIMALLVGGTSPWWWNKYIDKPIVKPEIIKKQEIYKKGNIAIEIKGVHISPSSFKNGNINLLRSLDLDLGKVTNNLDSDLDIIVNANKLLVFIELKEGVEIGKSETSYVNCNNLLKKNNEKKLVSNYIKTPTPYYCTETNNGRISAFKFTSIKRYKTPVKNSYTIIIKLKYTTWKL